MFADFIVKIGIGMHELAKEDVEDPTATMQYAAFDPERNTEADSRKLNNMTVKTRTLKPSFLT